MIDRQADQFAKTAACRFHQESDLFRGGSSGLRGLRCDELFSRASMGWLRIRNAQPSHLSKRSLVERLQPAPASHRNVSNA